MSLRLRFNVLFTDSQKWKKHMHIQFSHTLTIFIVQRLIFF